MASGSVNFNGKYKCYKNENFDDYMKATGAGFLIRKAANSQMPEIEIKQDGDHFILTTKSVRTTTMDFKIGQEFETEAPMGGKVKNTPKMDGNKLVIYSEFVKGSYKPTLATREIVDGELVTTLECEGVVAKRLFKRL